MKWQSSIGDNLATNSTGVFAFDVFADLLSEVLTYVMCLKLDFFLEDSVSSVWCLKVTARPLANCALVTFERIGAHVCDLRGGDGGEGLRVDDLCLDLDIGEDNRRTGSHT